MDDHGLSPGPGKTAPRLICDLLDYDPRYARRDGRNILVEPAPQYRGKGILRKGHMDCRHSLMKKVDQTTAPISNDEQPDDLTKYVVASYCALCRYHFTITVDFQQRRAGHCPCRLSDDANPMHHLRLVESMDSTEYAEKYGMTKYDRLTEIHRFVCSGENCPVVLEIKVAPPRLTKALLLLVTDPAKMNGRGRRVIRDDPERYAGMGPLVPMQALLNLRQYLLDARATTDPTQIKKIAKRNKKFVLGFADECDQLFEYLDFIPVQEESSDPAEGPNYFWQLPEITETNKNFIEDVLAELDLKINERSPEEQNLVKTRVVHIPLPALKDIERSLGYFDYPTRSRTVDLSTEEHPHYLSLGAVDNFTDDLLGWAYDRQCECDPPNKPYYLDCLEDLAKGRNSSDLQVKVAMAQSAGEVGLNAIVEAYRYFALDPSTTEGDDHIIGLYKSRIDSAPRQKDEARECLRVLAKARSSEKIDAVANDKTMSLDEALSFLGVSADTESDMITSVASLMKDEANVDQARVAAALRVIANERQDFSLQRAAASMECGTNEPTLDIGEAYNRLQMSDRNAPDETVLAYYQSLSNGAPAGSKESYTEALRVIAYDRQSNYLLRKIDDPNADVQAAPVTADQPVGLDNIGNTCYLNSLLQYYYTVKAVRDVVMDFQHHRMVLNEEDVKKKRVGGRAVAKSEIVKAQKFVDELHNLFENLQTASTRSIKPTRELAELTIFSSAAEANFRRASISSPGPPNLASILNAPIYGPEGPPPPVPSRPSPAPVDDDIEMIDRPGDKNQNDGDDSSEATLVDMDLLPPYNEIDKETKSEKITVGQNGELDSAVQEDDAVMVNGENSSSGSDNVFATPEKPPPIPPRNKSGLVIQTNESKDKDIISDDELWKFGSQQDVTEVIGNVMFRLQCAIKPTSIDQGSGEQIDDVRDTFFGANAVYNRKAQTLEKKVEPWANLIVFPAPTGPRDIYEALDVVFDEQIVEIDKTMTPQHTSIAKLPPILQIQIQRTAFDPVRQAAWKNRNPVNFPETIYLDRYMDSEDPNSALMRRRRETWKWKAELRILEARQAALKTTEAELTVPDALIATQEYLSALQEEEIDGVDIDPSLPDALAERIAEVATEMEEINNQITTLKQSLTEQFTDMRECEYKLQTVFIHRGEAGGGHYWIYIYDFENDIWREYNDEYVTVVKDRRRIFEHQAGAGGTPYYLAYVRSADKKDLVDAVCREVKEVEMMDVVTNSWAGQMDEGISMMDGTEDGEEEGESRHTEHAKPRPIRPKPAVGASNGETWDATWEQGQPISDVDANGRQW